MVPGEFHVTQRNTKMLLPAKRIQKSRNFSIVSLPGTFSVRMKPHNALTL